MDTLDAIQINFKPGQLALLNACLAFLMFGVALDLKTEHFRYVWEHPKASLVGLVSQIVLLPAMTLGLIYALNPPASVALGMALVAACPGGNVSNFAVHLSKGNTALSVTLTSVSTIAAILTTPIAFSIAVKLLPGSEAGVQEISVSPGQMLGSIVQLILVPLLAGMALSYRFPELTGRIRRPVRILSLIVFIAFIVVAIAANLQNIYQHLSLVFFIVLLHNGLALLTGYSFARLFRLPVTDARAISLETGIQNSGLGLILIFNYFNGMGGMAMIAAWWGVWHLVSAFALAMWWGRR
ncbi:MAG: bile acid:sodium symporter family protein [Saprospiraceae bacterium]|nr:bile acid:sodium symporter family protein [Saprospiraceae bacterium]